MIEKVTLNKGLKVGEVVHKEAELREATAGDFIDAAEESEKLVLTPEGNYVLIASPTLVGLNTLRRQIVKIGEYDGPLTMREVKMLSSGDINRLQNAAGKLDAAAAAEELAQRGRGNGAQK